MKVIADPETAGVSCIGIEQDEATCEIAAKRCSAIASEAL